MANTRVFFTSDVHGSEVCFMKFLNAAKFYQTDVLVLGGDVTGKMIVPIVHQLDGTAIAEFLGTQQVMRTPAEIQTVEKHIRNSGYYPYPSTPEEVEKLQADKKLVNQLFSKVMAAGIKRWINIAEEKLKESKTKCYISPGNDDRFEIDAVLKESSTVICPEDEVVMIDDKHEMISSGWVNTTPWNSPREVPEEQLLSKFKPMVKKIQNMEDSIFNLHVPPYNTPLDAAPELDATLKPIVKGGGGVSMIHVGSTTVRQLIETYKPMLGLHGHIHESRGFVKIGRTLCINPGSEYGEGILHGALINLEPKRVKSYILTQG